MLLTIKNLTKEILKNRVFLILLFVMTVFTSLMFFFIRFSIDGNMAFLNSLNSLSENQQNYMNALKSNTLLSVIGLVVFAAFTTLVFVMFYFRFYTSAKKQLGVLKALGTKNLNIQLYFSILAVVFSLGGLLLGMLGGYFISSIPLSANARSYNVSGLVKGINATSILLGLGLPLLLFAFAMFFCGFNLYGKENVILLSDIKSSQKQSRILSFADICVRKLPIKNKAPIRIAIRKPFSILLIMTASTVFTVMLVLGWSLTQSGKTVYKTQTEGHHYLFESTFTKNMMEYNDDNALYYLSEEGFVLYRGDEIEQTIFGMESNDEIYTLENLTGAVLGLPDDEFCYISVGLSEMYGIKAGQQIKIKTESTEFALTVKDIAYNAKNKNLIVSKKFLANALGIDVLNYNGVLSMTNIFPDADKVIDAEMREDMLSRDMVSSRTSAIMNQSIGLASGIILIFLALLITFQDSVKDMLIMDTLGYRAGEIKKLLINVFLPILIFGFIIMAFPSVLIAQGVQSSLALQMGDYMPFSTNILVLIVGFVIITAIYLLTQLAFSFGIKRITKKKGILQYTNSL